MPLTLVSANQIPTIRSSQQEVYEQVEVLGSHPLLGLMLEAMPEMAAILNANRQIILANSALANYLKIKNLNQVLGCRPGEASGCPNAVIHDQGCGCAPLCRNCGAAAAIGSALAGQTASCKCTIHPEGKLESWDLVVKASPLIVDDQRFVIFALTDVSREASYRILERTFFHDILNTAGGVQGLADLVNDAEDMDEVQEYAPLLANQAEQLVAAIESQRDMLAAERGELEVAVQPVGSLTVVQATMDLYRSHQVALDRTIARDPECDRMIVTTGKVLLQRTLGNMLKNALEASQPGETVTIGCRDLDGKARFWVHNTAVMPPEVRQKVFKRSFSTKGSGRGLGTYSMKLMGEKYLGGQVDFAVHTDQGTTFWIDLPYKPQGASD